MCFGSHAWYTQPGPGRPHARVLNVSTAEIIKQINSLPPHERLEVAQAAWSSLVDDNDVEIPVTAAQRQLLRERLDEARADPEAGRNIFKTSWFLFSMCFYMFGIICTFCFLPGSFPQWRGHREWPHRRAQSKIVGNESSSGKRAEQRPQHKKQSLETTQNWCLLKQNAMYYSFNNALQHKMQMANLQISLATTDRKLSHAAPNPLDSLATKV